MLQEEPEMEELQLHLLGIHEADCEKPEYRFTTGQRNTSQLFYKGACDRESTIHTTAY